jgi:hypothetical protein
MKWTHTLREQIVSRIDDVSGQFRLISNFGIYSILSTVLRQQRKSDVITSFGHFARSAIYYKAGSHCEILHTVIAPCETFEFQSLGKVDILCGSDSAVFAKKWQLFLFDRLHKASYDLFERITVHAIL